MSYVDLSRDPGALSRVFEELGLAQPGEPVHAQPLTGGVSSGIYRVDLASGRWCLKQALPRLKVAKLWEVPVDRVFAEIAYLRTAGAIVPGHVPQVAGEHRATGSFVMPFLGQDFRNWKALLLAGEVDVAFAARVGDMLGRIHAATADREDLARRFANDANFHALRLEPYLVEAARVHPVLAEVLLSTLDRTANTRRVLVHGDASPKNILVGPAGPVLLDAECAWYGDPAFDLAFCLNHFLLKAVHVPAARRALLEAGRRLADAYRVHARWEPQAALQRRVALLLPALALARVDGKSPVEYLDEAGRDQVRQAALALLHHPPDHLHALLGHWPATP
jgi:aminoglycoside phosphotransferase (APT) family kinase protein